MIEADDMDPLWIKTEFVQKINIIVEKYAIAGPSLERVPRVHGHPLKFGNGCRAPVLIRVQY